MTITFAHMKRITDDSAAARIVVSKDRERETVQAINNLAGALLAIEDRTPEMSLAIDQLQDAHQDLETAFFRARRAVLRASAAVQDATPIPQRTTARGPRTEARGEQ